LYNGSSSEAHVEFSRSGSALAQKLAQFLQPDIPGYWQKIAKCYYDHYIFQLNGDPVPTYPERNMIWVKQETLLRQRFRQWFRFNRGVIQMMWHRRRAVGIVP
jgi:hypothetical protein